MLVPSTRSFPLLSPTWFAGSFDVVLLDGVGEGRVIDDVGLGLYDPSICGEGARVGVRL